MAKRSQPSAIPLPKGWNACVKPAATQALSLARWTTVRTLGWAADSTNQRLRLKAENQRLQQDLHLLREEMRIKDARMKHLPANRRPHYAPTERMSIVELRAARGWSLAQTAQAMLVTAATIASWGQRIEEEGPHALLQFHEPVNEFPDYVRCLVKRLQALCPTLVRAFLG